MAKRKNREKVSVDGASQDLVAPVLGDMLRDAGYSSSSTAGAKEAGRKAQTNKQNTHKQSIGETAEPTLKGKLVLRRERKGRGGKTVTVLTGNDLPSGALEPLARELRRGLGCGSRVEGQTIVLQGDIADRACEWLRERGAKNVVCG